MPINKLSPQSLKKECTLVRKKVNEQIIYNYYFKYIQGRGITKILQIINVKLMVAIFFILFMIYFVV